MRQDKFDTQSPRSVTDIARDSRNPMGQLLGKARQIERINRAISQALGHELSGRFCVVPTEPDVITIVVADAASATRIKMETPEILTIISESVGSPCSRIQIRVDPQLSRK